MLRKVQEINPGSPTITHKNPRRNWPNVYFEISAQFPLAAPVAGCGSLFDPSNLPKKFCQIIYEIVVKNPERVCSSFDAPKLTPNAWFSSKSRKCTLQQMLCLLLHRNAGKSPTIPSNPTPNSPSSSNPFASHPTSCPNKGLRSPWTK